MQQTMKKFLTCKEGRRPRVRYKTASHPQHNEPSPTCPTNAHNPDSHT
jgi:hypothetical protein